MGEYARKKRHEQVEYPKEDFEEESEQKTLEEFEDKNE